MTCFPTIILYSASYEYFPHPLPPIRHSRYLSSSDNSLLSPSPSPLYPIIYIFFLSHFSLDAEHSKYYSSETRVVCPPAPPAPSFILSPPPFLINPSQKSIKLFPKLTTVIGQCRAWNSSLPLKYLFQTFDNIIGPRIMITRHITYQLINNRYHSHAFS